MSDLILSDLLGSCARAVEAADKLLEQAKDAVSEKVMTDGRVDSQKLELEQTAAHGLSWMATYVEALRQMHKWGVKLEEEGHFSEFEQLILQCAFGEYCTQLTHGIAISQVEVIRPHDLGLTAKECHEYMTKDVTAFKYKANTPAVRRKIAEYAKDGLDTGSFGQTGLDEELEMIRDQFRRFVNEQVIDQAPKWHDNDELIPLEIIEQVAEMGVFGLTIPEEYGGLGMGKTAMCVVTEELSRGYIGVGSLGTRNEIAGELIRLGGTEAQKEKYLPKIASGEILPTAVFTEPNTGSDLGSLKTRAVLEGDVYKVTGNKTWITHASRSDLMTLLCRTNPDEKGYKGLSMLLAEKPRGTDDDAFPAEGMSGGEIHVLGYRGMKEYELAFDGFEVPKGQLLGGEEGQGFKQLMETFESARIQTAARASGVATSALEFGLRYATERVQFGKPIFEFPRVHSKIAWMVVETMIAKQLTYFSGWEKDHDVRCDIEAGMAKLLAARVAWTNADNALQIHGGNGYATEYPISRVLCDSRILNVFEGAAEIQAGVIARGLLTRR